MYKDGPVETGPGQAKRAALQEDMQILLAPGSKTATHWSSWGDGNV